jgi:hypothetical protein
MESKIVVTAFESRVVDGTENNHSCTDLSATNHRSCRRFDALCLEGALSHSKSSNKSEAAKIKTPMSLYSIFSLLASLPGYQWFVLN